MLQALIHQTQPLKRFHSIKTEVNRSDLKKLVNVSTDLNDLKTKVDELDVNGNELETVTIELKILGHVVSKEIFKKINQVKKKNPDPLL